MLIGVDNGYTYTKNSKGNMFLSKVRTGETIDINNVLKVELEGQTYIVGERDSNYTVDINKIDNEITRVSVLTSIALAMRDNHEEIQLITGLPPGHYAKQKEELKEMLLNKNLIRMTINDREKAMKITNADVFIQGAGPIFLDPHKYRYKKVLVIDIGGLTVDVCCFENMNLVKYRTYEKGMLKLYSNMISKANAELELNLDISDGENILNNGLYIYGVKQDLEFLDEVINAYINDIFTNIKLDFSLKTMEYVLFIGGGSQGLYNKINIPNALMVPNSQFTNAISYEAIGRVRFG